MPSSVVLAMRYYPQDEVLYLAFRGRRELYRYFDVPAMEWNAFRHADSKGTYLNEIFKARGHRYEKLPPGVPPPDGGAELPEWGETWVFGKRAA